MKTFGQERAQKIRHTARQMLATLYPKMALYHVSAARMVQLVLRATTVQRLPGDSLRTLDVFIRGGWEPRDGFAVEMPPVAATPPAFAPAKQPPMRMSAAMREAAELARQTQPKMRTFSSNVPPSTLNGRHQGLR